MQFVRKIIESTLIEQVIDLPEELQHKKLELLVFPFVEKECLEEFNPEDFVGVLNIENVDGEIKKLRCEWERI